MSIFQTQSAIVRIHGPEKVEQLQSKVVKTISDASKAVKQHYTPTDTMLGEGCFGSVWLFEGKDDPNKKYAVKIMQKVDFSEDHLAVIREEISILSVLDHTNIITYVESYEDQRYMYIVMEYFKDCSELKTIIETQAAKMKIDRTKPILPEDEIRQIMFMLIKGLAHIHKNGIVHRDLKSENCLIDKELNLRIIDFGLSKVASNREFGNTMVGTRYYMAPEIFESCGDDKSYKEPVDMWSAGVIMYQLISGVFPFNLPELEQEIMKEDPPFFGSRWDDISLDTMDLLRSLLHKQPMLRITAQNALKHPYFKSLQEQKIGSQGQKVFQTQIFKDLTQYRGTSELKKAALNILARDNTLQENQETKAVLDKLKEQFEAIDEDQTGLIDAKELAKAMKQCKLKMSDKEIDAIIKEVDFFGNGINYSDFLSATMDL